MGLLSSLWSHYTFSRVTRNGLFFLGTFPDTGSVCAVVSQLVIFALKNYLSVRLSNTLVQSETSPHLLTRLILTAVGVRVHQRTMNWWDYRQSCSPPGWSCHLCLILYHMSSSPSIGVINTHKHCVGYHHYFSNSILSIIQLFDTTAWDTESSFSLCQQRMSSVWYRADKFLSTVTEIVLEEVSTLMNMMDGFR